VSQSPAPALLAALQPAAAAPAEQICLPHLQPAPACSVLSLLLLLLLLLAMSHPPQQHCWLLQQHQQQQLQPWA
jgi:hypothetical protein